MTLEISRIKAGEFAGYYRVESVERVYGRRKTYLVSFTLKAAKQYVETMYNAARML